MAFGAATLGDRGGGVKVEASHLPLPDRFAVCRGEGAEPRALPPMGEDGRRPV